MKNYFVQLTLGHVIFIAIGLLAAGFLNFYLGARFGPKLLWNVEVDRFQQEAFLPREVSDEELIALLADNQAPPITFHEVLEKKDKAPIALIADNTAAIENDPLLASDTPNEAKKNGKTPPNDKEKNDKEKKEVKKEKEDVKKMEVSKVVEPKPTPVADPVKEAIENEKKEEAMPASSANYSLQVGSFSSTDEAEALKSRLTALGFDAFVVPMSYPGKTMYRVRVGRFLSEGEAMLVKNKIESRISLRPSVVPLH